jgi:hypothetical protein
MIFGLGDPIISIPNPSPPPVCSSWQASYPLSFPPTHALQHEPGRGAATPPLWAWAGGGRDAPPPPPPCPAPTPLSCLPLFPLYLSVPCAGWVGCPDWSGRLALAVRMCAPLASFRPPSRPPSTPPSLSLSLIAGWAGCPDWSGRLDLAGCVSLFPSGRGPRSARRQFIPDSAGRVLMGTLVVSGVLAVN